MVEKQLQKSLIGKHRKKFIAIYLINYYENEKGYYTDDEIDIDKFLQEILVKNKRKIERAEKRQNSTKAVKLQKKRIVKSKKKSPARKQVKKKKLK